LVRINERFFLHGSPVSDALLDSTAKKVLPALGDESTFFEALTAVAFQLYADAQLQQVVLETGLGGRLDATNVCQSRLSVITRIGLDHCDWLWKSISDIAAEKAGIVKREVPVVLGRNCREVQDVVYRKACEMNAPFFDAPDMVSERDIPESFSLAGSFNRENALTALAAFKVLGIEAGALDNVIWPARFQRVGNFIVDGAHNPPAARALVEALGTTKVDLIAGFCADKDISEVLRILSPSVRKAVAVKTNNSRSLESEEVCRLMLDGGIDARAERHGLAAAISKADGNVPTLICGSLFLAGEALIVLGAYPWGQKTRFDMSELLKS
jgi:dihydrofolate synthase/folylpolyglutamate synthase